MNETLNPNFLEELFRMFLLKKQLVEQVSEHLKYQMLPTQEHKQVYQDIVNHVSLTNTLPTFGVLYEKNKGDQKVERLLKKMRDSEIVDVEPLMRQLEKYIKDVRFSMLFDKVIKIHKDGDQDGALKVMAKESAEISEFSLLKESSKFLRVFQDYSKVVAQKAVNREDSIKRKIPFGVLPCDIVSQGGMDKKDTVLWIMRSGVGKSTALKWQGMHACRLGFDVLHIQCEGAEEEAFDKYTQIWSALQYMTVRNANISDEDYQRLLDIANKMVVMGQDIYLKAYERFDEATMLDVRQEVVDYIKIKGKAPDLLILDSIDLVHPGDGIHYGVDTQSIKMKLQNSSRKFKNICNEFDMAGVTATQTGDIPQDILNDPNKVITRSNSMGDRNIGNSYSYVLTGNMTPDEEKKRQMRIFLDKVRYYNPGSRVYPICTNYELGRFQDTARTKKLFKDIYAPETEAA